MVRRKTEFLLCRWLQSHHFIVLMELSAFAAFISGYSISVSTGSVNPIFPYISDTGTTPPASCFFGLFLNMSAAFGAVAIYIRHRHVEAKNMNHHGMHKLNDISMLLGLLSCLGMMIVACFQWSVAGTTHLIGALMVFLLGGIYCWCQSVLSFKCISIPTSKVLMFTRALLSSVAVVGLVMTIMFTAFANRELFKAGYNATTFDWEKRLHWSSKYPGYGQHLVSVFSEWMMCFAFLLFFATYYKDFKNLDTKVHVNVRNSVEDNDIITNKNTVTV